MKKKRFLLFPFLITAIIGISFYLAPSPPAKELFQKGNCVQIPVRFIPILKTPTIEVEIEGSKYSLDLDLGCSHHLCLHAFVMEKIKEKEPLDSISSFDIKGNEYSLPGFRIPKIIIQNNLNIEGAIAREESIDFLMYGCQILPDIPFLHRALTKLYMSKTDGRIGLPLFKGMNCFFDFPNSIVFLAKDMKSIQEQSACSFDSFAKTPFELNHSGVVLTIETDLGAKRFLLDSGATWSLFKKSEAEKKGWIFTTNKFQIGNTDFGESKFWLYDLSDLMEVDGILGIDFFKNHAIYLDFHENVAYIR